ncbi:DUF2591 domain-containing protein [Burkholderia multivorans]|uniref:phage protein NinX family protein n=1 Tax=Burkholderia multivorans TaxID=87883 RepID=UPI001C234300|nr:phage protein NinX family protein [Burkholderia multivorans]MBU9468320.1 DUF2591 domain-containing protein [Burkholderia multivorans]MCA8129399.1 DUF2591 domain-containing protein [Burkholderia multivorans]
MKVSDLEGAQLDYWVARALGDRMVRLVDEARDRCETRFGEQWDWGYFAASRAWMEGGPIIERERIFLDWCDIEQCWIAGTVHTALPNGVQRTAMRGGTPLIAAMRAFVASRFGAEVQA